VEKVRVWYDSGGDYLEVMFEKKEGYFKEQNLARLWKRSIWKIMLLDFQYSR